MSTAAKPQERRVEVVAGLDEKQLCAAFELHQEWAREEGFNLDAEGWEALMRDLLTGGRYNIAIAWDGDYPVGCAETHVIYDCQRGENFAHGQRGFVLPAYRNGGVFGQLIEAIMGVNGFLGLSRQRLGAKLGALPMYERYGFKPVEYVMEKIV